MAGDDSWICMLRQSGATRLSMCASARSRGTEPFSQVVHDSAPRSHLSLATKWAERSQIGQYPSISSRYFSSCLGGACVFKAHSGPHVG